METTESGFNVFVYFVIISVLIRLFSECLKREHKSVDQDIDEGLILT
jgi:hypothetical protein